MAKSNVTKKRSLNIKGTLDVNMEDKTVNVFIEDNPEPYSLADFLHDFDSAEVSISVGESIDLA